MKYDYYNHLNEKIPSSAMDLTDKIKVLAIATIYSIGFHKNTISLGNITICMNSSTLLREI